MTVPPATRRRPIRRRILLACALIAAALHTLAALWLWRGTDPGLRGGALVWIDLPVSLLYLHQVGSRLLRWSLLAGGLWWALIGTVAAWLVGRVAKTAE